jgi:hypothetical protein
MWVEWLVAVIELLVAGRLLHAAGGAARASSQAPTSPQDIIEHNARDGRRTAH